MSIFSHITVGVRDLDAAKRFYDAVLGTLDLVRLYEGHGFLGYGAAASKPEFFACRPFDGQAPAPGNGWHAAFVASSHAAVDAFHAAALAQGGRDEGAPGLRDYAPDYYAAYVRDPDGNKLQAVCRMPPTR